MNSSNAYSVYIGNVTRFGIVGARKAVADVLSTWVTQNRIISVGRVNKTPGYPQIPCLASDEIVPANTFDIVRNVLLRVSDSTVGHGERFPS